MRAEDFVASAEAMADVIATPGLRVGERILRAVEATREVVTLNTNLGIVLLCAPLIHAAVEPAPEHALRTRLRAVLAQLDVDDACSAYRAIRMAQPGGLGSSPRHDVSSQPTVTLREAMREARSRDRIARQYVTDFEDVFGWGTVIAREALARWGDWEWAAVSVYLAFLARYPDSHVARKYGEELAGEVTREAQGPARALNNARFPGDAMPVLAAFDQSLKARAINPGTSADLTVATLMVVRLEEFLHRVYHGPEARACAGESAAVGLWPGFLSKP
jgi:triphosphoribosyl-dephospho-CoA synthase